MNVKGKTLEQIEDILCAPFKDADFGSNKANRGLEYLPVEKSEERLNAAFGCMYYDRQVSDLQVISAGNTLTAMLKMTLVFYDDNHNVIIRKSSYGGSDLQINDKGNAVSIKQAVAAAESDAFKHICSTLGIGTEQLRAKNYNDSSVAGTGGKQMRVKINGNWKRTPSYVKAECLYGENSVELCIFKDAFPELEKKGISIDRLVSECVQGRTFDFMGVESSYNGKRQVIFKGFAASS